VQSEQERNLPRRRCDLKAGRDSQVRDRLKFHLQRKNNLTKLEILVIIKPRAEGTYEGGGQGAEGL